MKNGWKHLTALLLAMVMLLCPLAGMTEENEIITFAAPLLKKGMDSISVDDVADSHRTGAELLALLYVDIQNASLEGKPLEGLVDALLSGEKYVGWTKPNTFWGYFYDERSQELVMIASNGAGDAFYGMVPNTEMNDSDNFEALINDGTIDGYYRVTDEEFQTVDDILEDANTK
ncbi:MAG: hypothetical protein RR653_14480 [Clostridia bacterium]